MHHSTNWIAHTTACVTPVVEHWLEREIAQWVHPMKDRSDDPSHHERTFLPRSYISLSLQWRHISLWLNPMGHFKIHNTSKHPPPAIDPGPTACSLLYLPVPPPSPFLLSTPLYSLSWTEEVPMTDVHYHSLL